MKPISNIKDIRKLKTDERLIECYCGKVNYYRLREYKHGEKF